MVRWPVVVRRIGARGILPGYSRPGMRMFHYCIRWLTTPPSTKGPRLQLLRGSCGFVAYGFRAANGGRSDGANWLLAVRRSDKVPVPAWGNGPIHLLPFVQPAFAVWMQTLPYCNPSGRALLLYSGLRLTYCTAGFHSGKLAAKGLRLTWIGFENTQPRREFSGSLRRTATRSSRATPGWASSRSAAVCADF